MALSCLCVPFLLGVELLHGKAGTQDLLAGRGAPARWAIYVTLTALMVLFGMFSGDQFIYFQF